jgi:hypothetical protein
MLLRPAMSLDSARCGSSAQELSQKVDGRVTVIANNPIAAAENGSSTRSQVSRVLQLASSVAAQGTSAPWVTDLEKSHLSCI